MTDEDTARRDYRAPFSSNRPVPTVKGYREHRDELQDQHKGVEEAQHTEEDESKAKRAIDAVKNIAKDKDKEDISGDPYPTANRHVDDAGKGKGDDQDSSIPLVPNDDRNGQEKKKDEQAATEIASGHSDPKQKRKDMKHNKRDDGGREVTDPVTHLPVVIRDSTTKDLHRAPENEPMEGSLRKRGTGFSSASKSTTQLNSEKEELQDGHDGMQKVFPPPSFKHTKAKIVKTYQLAFAIGLASIVLILGASVFVSVGFMNSKFIWSKSHSKQESDSIFIPLSIAILFATIAGSGVIIGLSSWLGKKVKEIWEDEVWDAARITELEVNQRSGSLPESVAWMNSLLASVWPLINPDLFASVVDMVEDVMQASLPKIVRMVSVDDMGQGSEAIRILGIRWLPTGAAADNVDEEGNLSKPSNDDPNDRKAPGEGQTDQNTDKSEEDSEDMKQKKEDRKKESEDEQAVKEGLEAEQGDFVNMELAFVYRARSSGKSLRSKVKNAHLYLKFYLPGGIFVPVWVELRGIIGTARLRLQLTPDPPFFSLCTLTFLGQPQVDLSCIPLSKKLPNLMNVPLISSFVQSSIDAALAEYVAPRSLTLDLKDMLVGDDFKKDTISRGVIVVFLKEAKDFKEGDGGIGPLKGSSDSYLTCSWGKFGKTIASTRVIEDDQDPKFHEWAYLLVSPQEIDAGERLRVQLWDSDRFTADDDLGRVEVNLHELMHNEETHNKMCEREDRFKAKDTSQDMPGTLSWSVGYYSKLGITDSQLKTQTADSRIRTKEEMKRHISESAERKLREATAKDESKEIDQQKAQDYKEREDAMICASSPDHEHPSGILSIQIHNITGLEVESLQKGNNDADDREDENEQGEDLPSSYCTIILNHKKIYMTRTKPKSAKPFFNAGTERFVRDWRTAEVMISVRDSRERENDPLLGIIYLPLAKAFKERSQVVDSYPIMGGMGFGRARVSMVFRSVELQLPKELLGWDYGTLEVKSPVQIDKLPKELRGHRIKLLSNLSKIKMTPSEDNGELRFKKDKKSDFLAFSKRYSAPLIIEFRKSRIGQDSTPAFAILWMKDLPDEEERTVKLQVWKGGKEAYKRATTCAAYGGEEMGSIEVKLKFWPGLSGYHKQHARKSKSRDMMNVMEVLDTVNDEDASDSSTSSSSSSSDSDSDSEEETSKMLKAHTNQDSSAEESDDNIFDKAKKVTGDLLGKNDSEDGERGVRGQVKDYNQNHKQLHRQHRGVMQWRAARSGEWIVGKVRQKKNQVAGVFHHEEKQGGVETEV